MAPRRCARLVGRGGGAVAARGPGTDAGRADAGDSIAVVADQRGESLGRRIPWSGDVVAAPAGGDREFGSASGAVIRRSGRLDRCICRLREWRLRPDGPGTAMLVFLAILLASVASAAWYSGAAIATASLARVLLFAISVYLYLFLTVGPASADAVDGARTVRWLLGAAFVAALIACVDFYYQLPAPAGYGAQFVWLNSGVFRRAQGLFYEASTLGNFCAFFLVLIAVVASEPAASRKAPRWALAVVGAVVSAALLFSYSRASIAALACALTTLLFLQGGAARLRRWLLLLPLCALAGVVVIYAIFPSSSNRTGCACRLLSNFSGRSRIASSPAASIAGEPWARCYSIIPCTCCPALDTRRCRTPILRGGGPVIADNMYLSLLVETGVPGLLAFLWLNAQILASGWRRARAGSLSRNLDLLLLDRRDAADALRRFVHLLARAPALLLGAGASLA